MDDDSPPVSVKTLLQQLEQRKSKPVENIRSISKISASKQQSPKQSAPSGLTSGNDVSKASVGVESAKSNLKKPTPHGIIVEDVGENGTAKSNAKDQLALSGPQVKRVPDPALSSKDPISVRTIQPGELLKAHEDADRLKSEAEAAKKEVIALRRQLFIQSENVSSPKSVKEPGNEADTEQLRAQLQSSQQELSIFRTNFSRLQSHHENLSKACVDFQAKVNYLQSQLQDTATKLRLKEEEFESIRRNYELRLRTLTNELESKPLEMDELKKQLQVMGQRRLEDAERYAEVQRAAARLQNEAEQSRAALAEAMRSLDLSRSELGQTRVELQTARSQTADILLETVRERDKEILELQKRVGEYEIQALHRPSLPDTSLDLKMKEMEVLNLRNALGAARRENEALQDSLRAANSQVEQLKNEVYTMNMSERLSRSLASDSRVADGDLPVRPGEHAQSREMIANMLRLQDDLIAEVNDLRRDMATLAEQKRALEQQVESRTDGQEREARELAARLERQAAQLEQQLQAERAASGVLLTELDSAKRDLARLAEERLVWAAAGGNQGQGGQSGARRALFGDPGLGREVVSDSLASTSFLEARLLTRIQLDAAAAASSAPATPALETKDRTVELQEPLLEVDFWGNILPVAATVAVGSPASRNRFAALRSAEAVAEREHGGSSAFESRGTVELDHGTLARTNMLLSHAMEELERQLDIHALAGRMDRTQAVPWGPPIGRSDAKFPDQCDSDYDSDGLHAQVDATGLPEQQPAGLDGASGRRRKEMPFLPGIVEEDGLTVSPI